jgi:hypothetical protein
MRYGFISRSYYFFMKLVPFWWQYLLRGRPVNTPVPNAQKVRTGSFINPVSAGFWSGMETKQHALMHRGQSRYWKTLWERFPTMRAPLWSGHIQCLVPPCPLKTGTAWICSWSCFQILAEKTRGRSHERGIKIQIFFMGVIVLFFLSRQQTDGSVVGVEIRYSKLVKYFIYLNFHRSSFIRCSVFHGVPAPFFSQLLHDGAGQGR